MLDLHLPSYSHDLNLMVFRDFLTVVEYYTGPWLTLGVGKLVVRT